METTFAIIVFYQYLENYAAFDWDGEGECPVYWKAKGTHEVVLAKGLSVAETASLGADKINLMIQQSELGFGLCNDYTGYHYMGHEIVELNIDVIEQVVLARETALEPDSAISISFETHLTEYQCQWALDQLREAS